MARTLAAIALPAFAIALSWTRLESPASARSVALVAALAVAPALLPTALLRGLALAGAGLGTAWVAFGAQPWELLPFRDERVLGPLLEDVYFGIGDYYAVLLPFEPEKRPEMEGLLLAAVFGFVAATALLVAARRPLAAGAVTLAGVCWPATLLGDAAIAVGAFALAAVLSIPLALRVRSAPSLAVGVALALLVVGGAAWTSSATTFNREAVLDWETWDLGRPQARALGVRFIWDAQYDGIVFPPFHTVVLRITAPRQAQYWRASTLDEFFDDKWLEDQPGGVDLRGPRGDLPPEPLLPRAARDRGRLLEQRVEVRALIDDRLVAAGTPITYDAGSLGSVFVYRGGVMRSTAVVQPGTRYRVWSYVADPSPLQLSAAPARYPAAARPYLTVWGQDVPAYGRPGRSRAVRRLLGDPSYWRLAPYAPLYDAALRVTSRARTPYAAVLTLESWFRQRGGFTYEEQPPKTTPGRPPLVQFVTETRAGYCQHYAGAMALMLRMLGIPARVAVGFTSGRYRDGFWEVSDGNAHAWVEAWFNGYGWIPFDPTPGRGRFSAQYSFASDSPNTVAALRRGGLEATRSDEQRDIPGDLPQSTTPDAPPSIFVVVFLLACAAAALVGTVKWLARRLRYVTIQPRRIASASRLELEAFLRDQGVPVPASATLDDLRLAVGQTLGLDGSRYFEAAGRGRFGPPRDARRAAQAAREELRVLLKRARSELSVWARLRGFVSLRSLRGWQG